MIKKDLISIWQALVKAIIVLLHKIPSTKWIAFIIATHMAYISLLDPQSWLMVAMLYMGVEGALAFQRTLSGTTTTPISGNGTLRPMPIEPATEQSRENSTGDRQS